MPSQDATSGLAKDAFRTFNQKGGSKVKSFKANNSCDFMGKGLTLWSRDGGIIHELSPAYGPQ